MNAGPSPFITLSRPDSDTTAKIYTFGAHVVSFQVDGKEKLWMSTLSCMDGSGPIRGGIPIAFPQFADEGPLKQLHGFVRESVWRVVEDEGGKDAENYLTNKSTSAVTMELTDNERTRAIWPHAFKLRYNVTLLQRGIRLKLSVTNTDDKDSFSFSGCLHTYFRFDNALDVALHGFVNTLFVDKADGRKEKVQDGPIEIVVESDKSGRDAGIQYGFVDRIHYNSPKSLEFRETKGEGKLLYKIKQSESWPDTTVYNPYLGDKQGPSFPDFDDDGYKFTICCEPTISGKHEITLGPLQSWEGEQEIIVPSSD